MTDPLKPAAERTDGKPWVPWTQGNEYLATLPGHRERISMEAWYDRDAQSLVLTITQYDESMSTYVPCWAQLSLIDTGPFFARTEITVLTELFAETIIECWGVGSPPE